MRTAMETMRTRTDAQLKKMLTSRQYTLIEQYRKKHPQRGFDGPGGGGNDRWQPGDQQSADSGNNGPGPDDNAGPPPPVDNMGPPPGGGDDMPPPSGPGE